VAVKGTLAAAIVVGLFGVGATARAQSLTTEADVTAGHSSEEINAGAVQARLFGSLGPNWRLYLEGSWGAVDGPKSDAFGAAFPYNNQFRPMETYAEFTLRPNASLVSVRMGRYRTPFGIYGRSDHAYAGFVRAPLIRYGGNWALSNITLEAGGAVLVGVPALTVETSVGVPLDGGRDPRPRTLDTVIRGQGYYRSLIVGASYLNSESYREGPWVQGRATFRGLDGRWMRGGLLVRGEWISGRPFDGVATRGGYLDTMLHQIWMGPVTAVARAARLDYDAGPFSAYLKRYTIGGRVRILRQTTVQLNVVHQPGGLPTGRATAVDFGITQSIRF